MFLSAFKNYAMIETTHDSYMIKIYEINSGWYLFTVICTFSNTPISIRRFYKDKETHDSNMIIKMKSNSL